LSINEADLGDDDAGEPEEESPEVVPSRKNTACDGRNSKAPNKEISSPLTHSEYDLSLNQDLKHELALIQEMVKGRNFFNVASVTLNAIHLAAGMNDASMELVDPTNRSCVLVLYDLTNDEPTSVSGNLSPLLVTKSPRRMSCSAVSSQTSALCLRSDRSSTISLDTGVGMFTNP